MAEVSPAPALGAAARGAVLWGAGFTLLRDVVQFGTMLVLVRLLSPDDYGRMALAQSALGLIGVASVKAFVPHALQARDPSTIDWNAHFTAATMLNVAVFSITLAAAGLLSLSERYEGAAVPLAGLSIVFLIEIPANLRYTMVQASHDWVRFRTLAIIGTLSASIAALTIALLGGGIWALIIPVLLFGLPAVVDLFCFARWRPDWSWSWSRYRDSILFGVSRMGSGGLLTGRQTAEQATLAGVYDFATLGVFSRSVGLATLVAGRIGSVLVASLYPVITRADRGSDRFQRISGLVLGGVAWTTIPAAVFLALAAADTVALLYGSQWIGVTPLLPLAASYVAFGGIGATVYSLLLANEKVRYCLAIDMVSAITAVALVFWLVPLGPQLYLGAVAAHGAVVLALALVILRTTGGIRLAAVGMAFGPPLVAAVAGAVIVILARGFLPIVEVVILRLGLDGLLFAVVFVAGIRLLFPARFSELLAVAPGGQQLARVLLLARPSP